MNEIPFKRQDIGECGFIREFFAMTIHQQNYHWGQLCQIAEMYDIDPE